MQQRVTRAIVLKRTNYGEADRILTVLTPDYGKLRLIARGVRKVKSKLAGGIELFSVSQITFIRGRGELATLISSRLESHYGNIVKDLPRVQLGYELLKQIDKNTEEETEAHYFELLKAALVALDDIGPSPALVNLYFQAQLLKLAGQAPNLQTDTGGQPLSVEQKYDFDVSAASFTVNASGRYSAKSIKFLRLTFGDNSPKALARIEKAETLTARVAPLVSSMMSNYLRL